MFLKGVLDQSPGVDIRTMVVNEYFTSGRSSVTYHIIVCLCDWGGAKKI